MRKPYDSAEIGDEIIEGESPMDWHVYWRESGRYAGDLLSPGDIQRKVSYQLRRKVSVADAKLHLANEFAKAADSAARAQMEQAKADALREHQKAVRDARSNPSRLMQNSVSEIKN